MNEIQEFFSKRGGPPLQLKKRLQVMTWDAAAGSWKLGGTFPLIKMTPDVFARAQGSQSVQFVREVEESAVNAPFFVAISRSGFRRLHMSHSCAVRQERCRETVPLFSISEDCADAVCQHCRPHLEAISRAALKDQRATLEFLEKILIRVLIARSEEGKVREVTLSMSFRCFFECAVKLAMFTL